MYLRKTLLNSKFKITTFSIETIRMCQYVKLLIILWSSRLFFNSYMMRAVTKNRKVLINRFQIDTGGITYMQRSSFMYRHVRNVRAVTFLNLKKHYILLGQLLYDKNWVQIQFTYHPAKAINFLLLLIVTYLIESRLNL